MKPGYKQTEIGVIPEEWEVTQLSEFAQFLGGGTPSKDRIDYWVGDVAWISSSDISLESIHALEISRFISTSAISNSATQLCPANAILVVTRVGVGKIAIAPIPMCTSQDFTNVILYRNSVEYVARFLQPVLSRMAMSSQGTSIKGITSEEVKNIKIAIPSLQEQEQIAIALSNVEGLISSLEALIAKKKAIKQGAMQELLTGKKRLPGFRGEWKQLRIGDFGELIKTSINPQLSPTIVYTEYSMPAFDAGQIPQQVAGRDMYSNRILISDGVLLFNKLNVRQKRVWLIEKCNNSAVCSAEFLPFYSDSVDLKLLKQLLLTDKVTEDFINMSTGTSNSQRRINPDNFLSYMVFMPVDIEEQHAIAEILSNMDSEIESLEQKLAKARQIKQGMMQQLLTGKIRLV